MNASKPPQGSTPGPRPAGRGLLLATGELLRFALNPVTGAPRRALL